jgi:selenoprotein W-related protein
VKLIESSGGAFEVEVDGRLVFSKKAAKRHAEAGEVLRLLKQATGAR